jgi:hypothetical protein
MNAAAISRFLGKTYKKSVSTKTRIRGWHDTTAGTIVSQRGNAVLVSYTAGTWKQNNILIGSHNEDLDIFESLRNHLTQNGYLLAENEKCILVIGKENEK